jgi:methyl-accepting chemotaxis protein
MNLDNAVVKHGEWKLKLRHAITNKETLDAAVISKDNQCELGKWLHGEGKTQCHHLPSYAKVVAAHAAFHKEVGKVANAVNAKKFDEASALMASGSAYAQASTQVGGLIFELKNQMAIKKAS